MAVVSCHHGRTYPYPEFFKVYVPEHSSEKLHVPPLFVSNLDGKGKSLPDQIFLRRRRHRSRFWKVEVDQRQKGAGGVFFHDGWGSFVRDFSLELGDLVTFRFDGDLTFYVTVFGMSMCEKEDVESDGDDDDEFGINVDGIVLSKKNLYFVTKVRATHRTGLHVPIEVLNALTDRDLKLKGEVILRDADGKEWIGNVMTWSDGRVWIGGWNAFCKRLGVDDRCICELVVEKGKKTVDLIQFHIVRA